MRKHLSFAVITTLFALAGAALTWRPVSADIVRTRAYIYPDRSAPDRAITVDDFRVNETTYDIGGVTYIWLHGPTDNYQYPFASITSLEVVRYLGIVSGDVARYQVRLIGRTSEAVHDGTIELRVMRGQAFGVPWYSYLAMQEDRGRNFWRICFHGPCEAAAPAAGGAPVVPPPPPEVVPGGTPLASPAPPPAMTEEERVERMTLDELDALAPLPDVFFDLDKTNIRPDQRDSIDQDIAWLKRFPSTRIRIEGHADERGTHVHNLGLGTRRANTVRQALIRAGIAANRVEIITLDASRPFCSEHDEECWHQNRRAHFVFTAK